VLQDSDPANILITQASIGRRTGAPKAILAYGRKWLRSALATPMIRSRFDGVT